MYCKNCGKRLDDTDTFCSGCGTRVQDAVVRDPELPLDVVDDSCKELPSELDSLLNKLRSILQSVNSKKKDIKTKMFVQTSSGDINIQGDLSLMEDMELFTTGNVNITHVNTLQKARFSYLPSNSEEIVIRREIGFKEYLILRRVFDEESESNVIEFHSDYCTVTVPAQKLTDTELLFISRKPVFIIYNNDRYYIWSENPKPDYLKIDSEYVPNSRIKTAVKGSDLILAGAFIIKL